MSKFIKVRELVQTIWYEREFKVPDDWNEKKIEEVLTERSPYELEDMKGVHLIHGEHLYDTPTIERLIKVYDENDNMLYKK